MTFKTYTLLVTLEAHNGADLSPELLETMVQRGLEEGVREMDSVSAAMVHAFRGDCAAPPPGEFMQAKVTHRELREGE